jgi:hypothetical protein
MKNRLLSSFALLIIIISSCTKEPQKEYYPGGILAGQTNGEGIIFTDVQPNDSIKPLKEGESVQSRFLDINKDGVADFEFYTYCYEANDSVKRISTVIPLNQGFIFYQPNYGSDKFGEVPYIFKANEKIQSFHSDTRWTPDTCLLYYYSNFEPNRYQQYYWTHIGNCYLGYKSLVTQAARLDYYSYGWIKVSGHDFPLLPVIEAYAATQVVLKN